MVATNKKASILGRRKQKTAATKTTAGAEDTAELDRIVKEKVVSSNNNKKWLKVKTALEETPKASNSTRNWQDSRGNVGTSVSSDDESRDVSAYVENSSFDSCGSSTMGESLNRVGSSWDDEDQQENAFFEKSVKVETHQAVVKVLEHGNTQMLVLEVSNRFVQLFFQCIVFVYHSLVSSYIKFDMRYVQIFSVSCFRLIQSREYPHVPSRMMWLSKLIAPRSLCRIA